MKEGRALAKLAGSAQRIAPQVAALAKVAQPLPIDIRRSVAAVQEELDLLRYLIRHATLQAAIDGPRHSADRQGAGQLGPGALLATFGLHHLRQDAPAGAGDVPCYGLALRLNAEAGRALPQCADAQVDDEAGHPARPTSG